MWGPRDWTWLSRRLRAPLRRNGPRRAVMQRLEVGTLVVVAGASGAGKSTFLDCLAARALPASIMAALPPGCADWPQTNGKRVIGKGARNVALSGLMRVEGAVQHYDILSPFGAAAGSYETDLALGLLKRADRIVVVDIRPGRDVLRKHLAERLAARRIPPFILRLIGRHRALLAGAWLERVPGLHRLTGNVFASRRVRNRQRRKDRHVLLHSLYERDDWLDGWHRRWDDYLVVAAGPRLNRIVHVTQEDGAQSPSFRLEGVIRCDGAPSP